MATKIEWATESWNPITGCTPVSEGCEHCYARRMAKRLRGRCGYPVEEPFRVTFHPDKLDQPMKWKKPRMIFVCSMGDLFHEDVKNGWLADIFDTMADARCEHHTFLILTKRPERWHDFMYFVEEFWAGDTAFNTNMSILDRPGNNIWLGVSAENQKHSDERIPVLLQIPAERRFVSIEPMLGPVDLAHWLFEPKWNDFSDLKKNIDWVIVGGESGPGARPMHPDWPRSIRDQCQAAGVPFFFKQWGGVNKKTAGRLLDGQEWNEYPETRG